MIRGKSVTRGAVVQIREGRNGTLSKRRGIVMGRATGDASHRAFERAYGPEYVVCEVYAGSKEAVAVASDAIKERKIAEAAKIIGNVTDVSDYNVSMLVPRGKVKKIPKICQLAVKAEKGKL